MKTIKTLLVLLLLTLNSCEKNSENDLKKSTINAIVLGRGMDCGDTYLIKFNDDVQGLPPNPFNNIFYAINLPQNLHVDNLEVYVNFRSPNNDELIPCTTMGISYPQIVIENE